MLADGKAFAAYDVLVFPRSQTLELALLDDLERVALLASVKVAKVEALLFGYAFELVYLMTYPLGKVRRLCQLLALRPSYRGLLDVRTDGGHILLQPIVQPVEVRCHVLDVVVLHCLLVL